MGGNGQGYVPESLPNIRGTTTSNNNAGFLNPDTSGAFYATDSIGNYLTGLSGSSEKLGFDASLSSSTYQDGAKVRPDTLLCNLVIKF